MIISVGSDKGGVGKTNAVINLAAAFAEMGEKCVIVDIDRPQFTLSNRFARAVKGVRCEAPNLKELTALLSSAHKGHIIVDCTPAIKDTEPLTIRAMLHSDIALVPVVCAAEPYEATFGFRDTILEAIVPENERLKLLMFISRYKKSSALHKSIRQDARNDFADYLLSTVIEEQTAIENAADRKKSVLTFAPDSQGAKAYRKLAQEIKNHANQ